MFDLEKYLAERRALVERELDARLPPCGTRPAVIHEAMRYSVLAGGKRLRPILCMAAAEAAGGDPGAGLVPGLAIELLHTYTLIHDDLPCMDNDDLRRGKPTAHKVFGEANALLAGDALLTLAFEWLAGCGRPDSVDAGRLVLELAQAAGSQGVIGGQVEDMALTGQAPDAGAVEYIHAHKTAALIRAAVRIGGLAAAAPEKDLAHLGEYGHCAGLAFQIVDDILNATSTAEQLGKAAGSDRDHGKVTYVAVHGLAGARQEAQKLIDMAIHAAEQLRGNTVPLVALAAHVIGRKS